jgi:hypothetical protein
LLTYDIMLDSHAVAHVQFVIMLAELETVLSVQKNVQRQQSETGSVGLCGRATIVSSE